MPITHQLKQTRSAPLSCDPPTGSMPRMAAAVVMTVVALLLASSIAVAQGAEVAAKEAPAGNEAAGDQPLPPPAGLSPVLIKVHAGALAKRSTLPLAEAVKQYPLPDYLKPKDVNPGADRPLPRTALRHYAAARLALKKGLRFRAIDRLRAAAALAPDRPEIIRTLGAVYVQANNKVRAAMYYRQSAGMDPAHLPTLFWLGRYELEQAGYGNAIAVLAKAQEQLNKQKESADPAFAVLVPHYLADALQRQGHDRAAIDSFASYLNRAEVSVNNTDMPRELVSVQRNRGISWMMVGDANHRINQPKQALAAYHKAESLGLKGKGSLTSRLLYTHLLMKQTDKAVAVIGGYLETAGVDDKALQYVRYVAEQGGRPQALAKQLIQQYEQNGQPANLAIASSDLLTPPKSWELLRKHLQKKPADAAVYEHLLRLCFDKSLSPRHATLGANEAILATVALIDHQPKDADRLLDVLLSQSGSAKRVLDGIRSLEQIDKPIPQYMLGRVTLSDASKSEDLAERVTQAVKAIEQAFKSDKRLAVLRLPLVKRLVAMQAYDGASLLLDGSADPEAGKVIELRVAVLDGQGKSKEAIDLINQQITKHPTRPELVISKAKLQLAPHRPMTDGERKERESTAADTLEAAIEAMPKEASLYEELFALLDDSLEKAVSKRRANDLLGKAKDEIPNERITRLRDAMAMIERGGVELASGMQTLRALLQLNPRDYDALRWYLKGLTETTRIEEAIALFERKLKSDPANEKLLEVGVFFYRDLRDWASWRKMVKRLLLQKPRSLARDLQLADVYLRDGQADKAVDLLEDLTKGELKDPSGLLSTLGKALVNSKRIDDIDAHAKALIKRFPKQEKDLVLEWAVAMEHANKVDRAIELLEANVKKFPTHAPSTNHLSYAYARKGIKLKEAERLVNLSLKEDRNAAYIDTLGWVYYKMGRFAEAERLLRESVQMYNHPVVIDHLGDALWKGGQKENAVRMWQAAAEIQAILSKADGALVDPESEAVTENLQRKIRAATLGQEPPVAPVGKPD